MDIEPWLEKLFVGTGLKNHSLRGLAPGMTKDEAANRLQRIWRFENSPTAFLAGMSWQNLRQDGSRCLARNAP